MESLKPLPKEIIGKYIKTTLPGVSKKHNASLTIANQEGISVGIIVSKDEDSSKKILSDINRSMLSSFDTYIEEELEELASHFNRSLIFFESEVNNDKLFIRWV